MSVRRLCVVACVIAVILSACEKKQTYQTSKVEQTTNAAHERPANTQVPQRIFEGYPARIAAAINEHEAGVIHASQNAGLIQANRSLRGFAPYYIIQQTRIWAPGSIVTVAFNGGSPQLRAEIEQVAKEWTAPSIANVTLSFRDSNGQFRQWAPTDNEYAADVRIAFSSDANSGGYWSAVGQDSIDPRLFPAQQQSMNFDSFDVGLPPDWKTTVLHEFGHALGFQHEHQSPNGGCDFRFDDDPGYIKTQNADGWFVPDANGRRPGLYTYLGGPKNNWSRERVDSNLRQFPTSSAFLLGPFDRSSIMLYAFDPFMFVKGAQSPCYVPREAIQISAQDKTGAARAYPASAAAASRISNQVSQTMNLLVNTKGASSEVRASIQQRLEARKSADQ